MARQLWMQAARERMERKGTVGALRSALRRMGLVKGNQPISKRALDVAEARARKAGDTTLLRRINFARVAKRISRRRATR